MTAPHEDDLRELSTALRAAVVSIDLAVEDLGAGRPWQANYCAGVERAFDALRSVGRTAVRCPHCNDSGLVADDVTCPDCPRGEQLRNVPVGKPKAEVRG